MLRLFSRISAQNRGACLLGVHVYSIQRCCVLLRSGVVVVVGVVASSLESGNWSLLVAIPSSTTATRANGIGSGSWKWYSLAGLETNVGIVECCQFSDRN